MILKPLQSITLVGGGSWAKALVKIFSESRIHVTWYLRSLEHVNFLRANSRNPNYLSFLQLNMQDIIPTNLLEGALNFSDEKRYWHCQSHRKRTKLTVITFWSL